MFDDNYYKGFAYNESTFMALDGDTGAAVLVGGYGKACTAQLMTDYLGRSCEFIELPPGYDVIFGLDTESSEWVSTGAIWFDALTELYISERTNELMADLEEGLGR